MTTRAIYLLLPALAAVAGCASAPARFYTLSPTATAAGVPPAHYAVIVGPVSVPATVDRPEFVIQVGPNRVEVDEFNRWAAPLNDTIARTIVGDLTNLLGTPQVATAPLAQFNPDYRVTIDVERFDAIAGEAVVIEAVWAVRTITSGKTQAGRTIAREAVQGDGFAAYAAAHSRALAKVSADIAATIRAAAEPAHGAATDRLTARQHEG